MEEEASGLGRLTSRLLRTARLDREEVKLWLESMDMTTIAGSTVARYSILYSDREISLTGASKFHDVLGDVELLRLALSQLLDNACKYSRPESGIGVDITSSTDSVSVRIWSNQPISVEEREKIFDRYYRGSAVRNLTTGSGLGLHVARKIAVAHGASLRLESENLNSGASFCLEIPAIGTEC